MESLEAKALLSFLLGHFILLITLNLPDCHSQIPSAGSGQGLTTHSQAAHRALPSLRDSSEIHKIRSLRNVMQGLEKRAEKWASWSCS